MSIIQILSDIHGDSQDAFRHLQELRRFRILEVPAPTDNSRAFQACEGDPSDIFEFRDWLVISPEQSKPVHRILIFQITPQTPQTAHYLPSEGGHASSVQHAFKALNLPAISIRYCVKFLAEFYSYPTLEYRNQTFAFSVGFWSISWSINLVGTPDNPAYRSDAIITVNALTVESGSVFDSQKATLQAFTAALDQIRTLSNHPCYIGLTIAIIALGEISVSLEDSLSNVAVIDSELDEYFEKPASYIRKSLFSASSIINSRHSWVSTRHRTLQTINVLMTSLKKQNAEFFETYKHMDCSLATYKTVSEVIATLEQKLCSLDSRAEYLKHRDQIQLSTVFNLIAQSDSVSGLKISNASKRDAESMKTLAIVTMIFLPGTFIAALFATPFFDASQSVRLGPDMWVYWAITIPLTILTLGSWWLWLRQKARGAGQQHIEIDEESQSFAPYSHRHSDRKAMIVSHVMCRAQPSNDSLINERYYEPMKSQ